MVVTPKGLGDTGTLIYSSQIKLPYTWHVGKVGSRFYKELKENCKIWGTKCPQCEWVFVPPRGTCPQCFRDISEWVELSNVGTLLTYTIVRYSVPSIQPYEPPYSLGIVKLDGASSGLVHLLGEIDIRDIQVGIRVQAVFREAREGNYMDIKYFKPCKS